MLIIYKVTKNFPSEERFGLTSDIRRSANSIVHNIAEGFGRYSPKDKSRFYVISRGSTYELFSQSLTAAALQYTTEETAKDLTKKCQEIIDELDSLIKTVETQGEQRHRMVSSS